MQLSMSSRTLPLGRGGMPRAVPAGGPPAATARAPVARATPARSRGGGALALTVSPTCFRPGFVGDRLCGENFAEEYEPLCCGGLSCCALQRRVVKKGLTWEKGMGMGEGVW